jgi:TonB family protein
MNTSVIRGDWTGQVIDRRFTLLKWLGGTESSGVFLTELAGDRPQKAAIKFIPADAADAEARMAGWAAATDLSHRHLMRLFHTGRCRIDDAELLYAVTEFAEENLAEIIPERPLTAAETSEMLDPVLDALSYLHEKGFAHGHLKPSNIMVVEDRVKLSVDGLYLSGRLWKHLPTPGVYDAPETATRMSPAADAWSLGVTTIEALTQQRPSWDKSKTPDPVVPESVPQPFAGIARACLRRDPARRCTIDEIKSHLDRQLDARVNTTGPNADRGRASTLSARADKDDEVDKWKPPRFPLAAIIAGVIALLAVIAVWRFSTHKSAPENAADQSSSSAPTTTAPTATGSATSQSTNPSFTTRGPEGTMAKGAVVERVMPDVVSSARESIRGTVRVGVRVTVDPSGGVSNATLESAGPSRYFSNQALQASRRWKFKPTQVSSTWILRYAFRRSGTEVTPVEVPAASR